MEVLGREESRLVGGGEVGRVNRGVKGVGGCGVTGLENR